MNRPLVFLSADIRRSIEAEIERLITLLDVIDGDADCEEDDLDTPGFIWGGSEEGWPAHSGR